jgi:hypothetical protein
MHCSPTSTLVNLLLSIYKLEVAVPSSIFLVVDLLCLPNLLLAPM